MSVRDEAGQHVLRLAEEQGRLIEEREQLRKLERDFDRRESEVWDRRQIQNWAEGLERLEDFFFDSIFAGRA